jgi:hypothetical protein
MASPPVKLLEGHQHALYHLKAAYFQGVYNALSKRQ